jgi:hypothetical protein
MKYMRVCVSLLSLISLNYAVFGQRLPQDPLITLASAKSLGDNINGPSVIRVPAWISNPLGRYYLYFAHHKGDHIRLAYSDALTGPWKIYDPGVLNVKNTIFYRPQPDPPASPESLYTHVASPEIFIDEQHRQLVMYVHGMFTDGNSWPSDGREALKWMRQNGYAQFTQTTVSRDGLHFEARAGITARTSYQRIFQWGGAYYSMGRLGVLGRSDDPLGAFRILLRDRRCAGENHAIHYSLERRLAQLEGLGSGRGACAPRSL